MSLIAVTCACGSVENLVRKHLRMNGCAHFMEIPISKGKDKALSALNSLPQHEKINELREYISGMSRFAIVVGWGDGKCGWADLNSPNPEQSILAGVIIKRFAI